MLETTRLKLVPLTHEQLLLYKNDPKGLAESLNVKFKPRQNDPSVIGEIEEATNFWIINTLKFPDKYQWYTTWEIILKEEHVAIGGIGFAGYPDVEGKSMVGYGLDMRYYSRGYGTEALASFLHWGFGNQDLKCIVADTPLSNIPSQKLLLKDGVCEVSRGEELIHWQHLR